jgi:hypothetical protein
MRKRPSVLPAFARGFRVLPRPNPRRLTPVRPAPDNGCNAWKHLSQREITYWGAAGAQKGGNVMSRFLKTAAIALLALFFLVPAASAQRGGGFVGHGGFGWRGGFYGGGFYGGGWGWYGPGWGWGWGGYYPYYWGGSPYYGYGYGYEAPRYGDVKIMDAGKDAMVYVDGGYAGRVGQLKKFRLPVGNHNIELRYLSGHTFHQERIHVLPGKTLEIHGTAGGH